MKVILLSKSCLLLLLFLTLESAYSMDSTKSHSESSSVQTARERKSADRVSGKSVAELQGTDRLLLSESSTLTPANEQPSNAKLKASSEDTVQKFDELLKMISFPLQERAEQVLETIRPAVMPPSNNERRVAVNAEPNKPLFDIEQNLATIAERKQAASNATEVNRENLALADVAVKQAEFKKLGSLWSQVEEVCLLLQEERNQLSELITQIELSQSLLESQHQLDIKKTFAKSKPLVQNKIASLKKAIIPHEKMVFYLFRGAKTIDEWMHEMWTNDFSFAIASSSGKGIVDPVMAQVEEKNSYKNGASLLQIFAANHVEDEDDAIASFFYEVADFAYDEMEKMQQEQAANIMKRNGDILDFCSNLNAVQRQIREDDDLSKQVDQEAASLYQEAIRLHKANSLIIMEMVKELMSGNDVDPVSKSRSQNYSESAYQCELKASNHLPHAEAVPSDNGNEGT